MTDKQTLLLVFGGESSEHDVSIISARNVYEVINQDQYEVRLAYISRDGAWYLVDGFDGAPEQTSLPIHIQPGAKSIQVAGESIRIDIVFPLLHGKNGEDGTVQGLAAMAHIPTVGPSLLGAAVTMDKDMTKRLLKASGITVVPWVLWRTVEAKPDYDVVSAEFGNDVFAKPSSAGSSFGVSRARTPQEFDAALNSAAEHDAKVIIEPAIAGREVQVGIYGKQHPRVSSICEIESHADFHDFEDKYSEQTTTQFHIPARLSDEQTARIKQLALDSYLATECRGMARVDFFVTDDGEAYVNEINTIPGFTGRSVFPMVWQADGVSYAELVQDIIALALEQ